MTIGQWQPLWLDPEDRCLYAGLHRPISPAGRAGVVSVPPLLHEQPRSRRFVTEAASALAARGLPCLRFDYFGTGDSRGSGEELDLESMHRDLALAVAELRSRTGVERVVLLAWRGAALPVSSWLARGRHADIVVLWEPITDGARWLAELEHDDARERQQRPRMPPGMRREATANDGQLMGFAASARLRRDLASIRLVDGAPASSRFVQTWALRRPEAPPLAIPLEREFVLPAGAPTFNDAASMEATFFLSPPLERVVDDLGRTLMQELR